MCFMFSHSGCFMFQMCSQSCRDSVQMGPCWRSRFWSAVLNRTRLSSAWTSVRTCYTDITDAVKSVQCVWLWVLFWCCRRTGSGSSRRRVWGKLHWPEEIFLSPGRSRGASTGQGKELQVDCKGLWPHVPLSDLCSGLILCMFGPTII